LSSVTTFENLRESIRGFWHKRLYDWRYFIILGFVYAVWKGYKEIYYRNEFLSGIGSHINNYLSIAYIKSLGFIAHAIGEIYYIGELGKDNRLYYYIQLAGSDGIYIGWHCLAVPTMVVFTGSILLFRGSFQRKMLYILIGNVIIYLTNIFRLAGLMFMEKYSSGNFFRFNHSVTYLVLTYTIVFLLIIFYMRKLEPPLCSSSTS